MAALVGEAAVAYFALQHTDNLNPVWNETLKVRAADDIDNPELHIVLYDYDAAIPGNILSVEDDFLGEIPIPLPKDGG